MVVKQQLRISALEETLEDREIVPGEQFRQFYHGMLESLEIPQASLDAASLLDLIRSVELPEAKPSGPDMWNRDVSGTHLDPTNVGDKKKPHLSVVQKKKDDPK